MACEHTVLRASATPLMNVSVRPRRTLVTMNADRASTPRYFDTNARVTASKSASDTAARMNGMPRISILFVSLSYLMIDIVFWQHFLFFSSGFSRVDFLLFFG